MFVGVKDIGTQGFPWVGGKEETKWPSNVPFLESQVPPLVLLPESPQERLTFGPQIEHVRCSHHQKIKKINKRCSHQTRVGEKGFGLLSCNFLCSFFYCVFGPYQTVIGRYFQLSAQGSFLVVFRGTKDTRD